MIPTLRPSIFLIDLSIKEHWWIKSI